MLITLKPLCPLTASITLIPIGCDFMQYCRVKKMHAKILCLSVEAIQLGLSAGVLCHVFMSPVQVLPWELALPLRSSSSESTVACP